MIIFQSEMKYVNWVSPELDEYLHSFFNRDCLKNGIEEFIKYWYGENPILMPDIPKLDNSEELAKAEHPVHANNYIRKYENWGEIPTVDKLIRNHANFLHIPIETYHTRCELIVLIQFLDDYALCVVNDMTSTELVCEPPMHELTGAQWSTYRCDDSFKYMKYNPLCFVNLKSQLILRSFDNDDEERRLTIIVNANTVC